MRSVRKRWFLIAVFFFVAITACGVVLYRDHRSGISSSILSEAVHAFRDTFIAAPAEDGGADDGAIVFDDGASAAAASSADEGSSFMPSSPPQTPADATAENDFDDGAPASPSLPASPSPESDQGSEVAPVFPSSSGDTSVSDIPTVPAPAPCAFPNSFSAPSSTSSSKKIIFNEIAWMGSPSSSVAAGSSAANAEWMELKNNSGGELPLRGWSVENASGKIAVRFGADQTIAHGGFLLLVRGSTTLPYAHADEISYSGDLKNSGDDLALFDPSCDVSDFVAAGAAGWPAGDNTTKKTMERDADGNGWHTSAVAGGSPGEDNSVAASSSYSLNVVFQGAGAGTISSDPQGLACGANSCSGVFDAGTSITLTAHSVSGASFDGWTGGCSGTGACTFLITGNTSITAGFHTPILSVTTSSASDTSAVSGNDAGTPASSSSAPGADTPADPGHILIIAVQIAGTASSNDYVKLYNPGTSAVDMSGWKLRKRSATGTDYSLRTFAGGTIIGAGSSIIWANSEDGFAASIGADVSSTETLAADNSVALLDGSGNVIDAVAWGTGTGQYGTGDPYPTDPAAGQVLARKTSDGSPVNSGDNANDFTLQ